MLQKINCPNYIQDQIKSGDIFVDVAILPWDEFHFLMCVISENNRKLVEANTLIADVAAGANSLKLKRRSKIFLEE